MVGELFSLNFQQRAGLIFSENSGKTERYSLAVRVKKEGAKKSDCNQCRSAGIRYSSDSGGEKRKAG